VGTDPHSDLAVVKIDAPEEELHPIAVADSTTVHVGQLAVAIGNPFGLDGTMTVGFVSALGRSLPVSSGGPLAPSYNIPDIIQTDAPINPGNSGGVLVDSAGRLIGVPTAIESPVRANAGIGFAVPSAIVANVVPDLINTGTHEHPWLGLSGSTLNLELAEAMDLESGQRGVLVSEVVSDSPADEAGLRGSDRTTEIEGQEVRIGGDVIIAIDGEEVLEFEDLIVYLSRYTRVGQTVELTVLRDGAEKTLELTLRARPSDEAPAPPLREAEEVSGGWLGIQGMDVTPAVAEAAGVDNDQAGVLIGEIVSNSPADEAGLRGSYKSAEADGQQIKVGGDIIIALDGEAVMGMADLKGLLDGTEPGQEVTLEVLRDGEEIEVVVTLGERPAQTPQ
jgi:S1-C subfamily serine protease